MAGRDEFGESVKRAVALRVGNRCSNPDCQCVTSGPQSDESKAVNVGVAAHITAAASGGPRYDSTLMPHLRSGPENAIWLCQTCAKRVDSDADRYSTEVLRGWKREAESAADAALGKATPASDPMVQIAIDLSQSRRPWLFIVSERLDPITGRIHLTVQNKGTTPAYNVIIEHWGEVSEVTKGESFEGELPPEVEERLRLLKFFRKEYDSRTGVPPDYGGRSASMRIAMLQPDGMFEYSLTDETPEIVARLAEKERHVRIAGRITYTDINRRLVADYPFCYETRTLNFLAGKPPRLIFFKCPDLDLNVSR
jgi:hypothetical protein